MARVTERIRLGPAALNPFTLHPYEIAGQIALLDSVSDGRAYLGLAKGAWLDRLGLEEERPLAALREAVAIVRALLAGDESGLQGERFVLEAGTVLAYPRRRESVPLMIGTWGPSTARWAGTVADELKVGGSANPDVVPVVRGWLEDPDVKIVLGCVTVVDEDGDWARGRARGRSSSRTSMSSRISTRRCSFGRAGRPARAVLHRRDARGGRGPRDRAVGRWRGARRARDAAGAIPDRRCRDHLRPCSSAPRPLAHTPMSFRHVRGLSF